MHWRLSGQWSLFTGLLRPPGALEVSCSWNSLSSTRFLCYSGSSCLTQVAPPPVPPSHLKHMAKALSTTGKLLAQINKSAPLTNRQLPITLCTCTGEDERMLQACLGRMRQTRALEADSTCVGWGCRRRQADSKGSGAESQRKKIHTSRSLAVSPQVHYANLT